MARQQTTQDRLYPRAKNRPGASSVSSSPFSPLSPIVVLAPALIYFVAPEMGTLEKSVVSGTIFARAPRRPIWSVIFGHSRTR